MDGKKYIHFIEHLVSAYETEPTIVDLELKLVLDDQFSYLAGECNSNIAKKYKKLKDRFKELTSRDSEHVEHALSLQAYLLETHTFIRNFVHEVRNRMHDYTPDDWESYKYVVHALRPSVSKRISGIFSWNKERYKPDQLPSINFVSFMDKLATYIDTNSISKPMAELYVTGCKLLKDVNYFMFLFKPPLRHICRHDTDKFSQITGVPKIDAARKVEFNAKIKAFFKNNDLSKYAGDLEAWEVFELAERLIQEL